MQSACSPDEPDATTTGTHDPSGTLVEAVRMIPIETPKGTFKVWTRKVGDNPSMKVLLLHGGPGATHEYLKPLAGPGLHLFQEKHLN